MLGSSCPPPPLKSHSLPNHLPGGKGGNTEFLAYFVRGDVVMGRPAAAAAAESAAAAEESAAAAAAAAATAVVATTAATAAAAAVTGDMIGQQQL